MPARADPDPVRCVLGAADGALPRLGWLMILDEVQTGMGRCGTMFTAERWVAPRPVLLGKGLAAGGQPLAGVLGTEEVLADSDVHSGGTFAWVPAACAGRWPVSTPSCRRALANVARMESIAGGTADAAGRPVGAGAATCGSREPSSASSSSPTWRPSRLPRPSTGSAPGSCSQGRAGHHAVGEVGLRMQPALNMPPELFRWSCEQVCEAIAEVSKRPPPNHRSWTAGPERSGAPAGEPKESEMKRAVSAWDSHRSR